MRLLLETYKHPEHPYLFPSRHLNHRWKHAHPEAACHLFQEACEKVGIIGASTHSLRRSALTSDEQRGYPIADYSRNQRAPQPRTVAEILRG
ncbi:hypothetical protein QUB10_15005 [Microcoleus sp. B5-D4]|uniref:hypothetical protein n=1 Tax=unclassified Microcoleus TaxID=2642155 RepID=UPI002FD4DA36